MLKKKPQSGFSEISLKSKKFARTEKAACCLFEFQNCKCTNWFPGLPDILSGGNGEVLGWDSLLVEKFAPVSALSADVAVDVNWGQRGFK